MFFLRFGGAVGEAIGEKVIKFAAPGREEKVLREEQVTRFLHGRGLEVPPVE